MESGWMIREVATKNPVEGEDMKKLSKAVMPHDYLCTRFYLSFPPFIETLGTMFGLSGGRNFLLLFITF